MLDSSQNKDLEKRLGLYQVFLRLYEHNRGLLDEILNLENSVNKLGVGVAPQYLLGVVGERETYLIANLLDGKTQALVQLQQIWVIGRDRSCAVQINDQRLSRRHAVIQYIKGRGFYLVDLNSSNGSFINGESVRHSHILRDGDRIRLGSLAFSFFACQRSKYLSAVPQEVLAYLKTQTYSPQPDKSTAVPPESNTPQRNEQSDAQSTALFLKPQLSSKNNVDKVPPQPSPQQLTVSQREEILERFLNKQGKGGDSSSPEK